MENKGVKCLICLTFYVLIFLLYALITKYRPFHNDSKSHENKSLNKQIGNDYSRGNHRHAINLQNASKYRDSISETCARYNLTVGKNITKRHYLKSPDDASLYCWIRKVASTSFTKFYSDLRNRNVTKDYYKEIDILSPKTINDLEILLNDDEVFKFLLVRHPFERILSSYRDRIEDNTKYTAQAWIYAPKIFHLTRPDLFRTNKSTGSSLEQIFNNDRRLKLVPRFDEFINWLLQTPKSKDDVHWDSYHSHCSICIVDYNYIVKLDDHSVADMNFLLSIISVNATNKIRLQKLEKTRDGSTNYKETCRYFRSLTNDTILKLYQRYQIDFQMFHYDYKNYMKCADST